MKITELLKEKQQSMRKNKPVTIAFLGDSVTQGCFECFMELNGDINTIHDYKSAYSTRVREILNLLYPRTQVNIINSGISGDNALGGLTRLTRDVLSYHPDLVVVSFGLNDSVAGPDGLDRYKESMGKIFETLQNEGIETILLTQNFMCEEDSPHIHDERLRKIAQMEQKLQSEGVLKSYFEAAKTVAAQYGARICDLYAMWERMSAAGVSTTNLLSNYINHPVREYHYYIAVKLVEEMLS
jgi:lysophospholipase L1-like esterase